MWGGGGGSSHPPPLSQELTPASGGSPGNSAAQVQHQQQQLQQLDELDALPPAPPPHHHQQPHLLQGAPMHPHAAQQHVTSCGMPAAPGGQTAASAAGGIDPDDVVTGVPVAEYAQQWQAMAVQQQALMAWYGQAWLAQMHQGSYAQDGAPLPPHGMGMLAHNQVSQMYQQLMSSQQQMATTVQQQQQQQHAPWMQPPLPTDSHQHLSHQPSQQQQQQQQHGSGHLAPCEPQGGNNLSSFGAAHGIAQPGSASASMPPGTSSNTSMGGSGGWGALPASWPPPPPPLPQDPHPYTLPPGPWPRPPPPHPFDLPLPPDGDHLPDPYSHYQHPTDQHPIYGSIGGEGMGMLGPCGMMDVVDGTEEGEDPEEDLVAEGDLGTEHSQGGSPAISLQHAQQPHLPADGEGAGAAAGGEVGGGRRRRWRGSSRAVDAAAISSKGGGLGGRRGERQASAAAVDAGAAGEVGQQQAQSSSSGGGGGGGGGMCVKLEEGSVQQSHKEVKGRGGAGGPATAGRAAGAAGASGRGTVDAWPSSTGTVVAGAGTGAAAAGSSMPPKPGLPGCGATAVGSGRVSGTSGGHTKRELPSSYLDPNAAKRGRRMTKDSKVCKNCGTTNTPFWRKDKADGKPLCNACGLYFSKNESHRPKMLWKEDERLGLSGTGASLYAQATSSRHTPPHAHSGAVDTSAKGGAQGAGGPSASTPRPGMLKMPPSAYLVGLPPLPPALANFLAAAVAASGAVPGSPAAHAAAAAAASAITKMPAAGGGGAGPPGSSTAGPSSVPRRTPPPPVAMPPAPPPVTMPPAAAPLTSPLARHAHPPAPPPAIAMPPPPPLAMPPPPAPISNPKPPPSITPPPAVPFISPAGMGMPGRPALLAPKPAAQPAVFAAHRQPSHPTGPHVAAPPAPAAPTSTAAPPANPPAAAPPEGAKTLPDPCHTATQQVPIPEQPLASPQGEGQ